MEALQKLHKRLKTTDTYFDDRYDSSVSRNTVRTAWVEVRDNVDRGASHTSSIDISDTQRTWPEAETRVAFIASLSSEVITPLVALKVRAGSILGYALLKTVGVGNPRTHPETYPRRPQGGHHCSQ